MTADGGTQLPDELVAMNYQTNEQLFGMSSDEVGEFQLEGIRRRFREVRPNINVVSRLAEDVGVTEINDLADITPLCLPHTMYKSYALSYIEQGRYDKLTSWLANLTTHDLSRADISGCTSLESWLDRLEETTPLRPACSSGTTGKISFFPASSVEQLYRYRSYMTVNGPFRDEPDSHLASGEVDYFAPWPVATGRHNIPKMFELMRKHLYGHRPGKHVFTLGEGHWDVDLLWLSGRMRAAEARGELAALRLPPDMEKRRHELAEMQARASDNADEFIEELMVRRRGETIFLFAPFGQMIALAQQCKARGLRAEFSPDSYILGGGRSGSKGGVFPDGWLELCKDVFPFPYNEIYGMTESTGVARRCPAGHFHLPPWIVLFLLDPDTSAPLARSGVQTGRLALFDLLPSTFWGGFITGDRVTINWDGGCSCGRNGPFVHADIERYAALRDDDKITCAKSPDAYERAVEVALGTIE
jgi:hypothetical protein